MGKNKYVQSSSSLVVSGKSGELDGEVNICPIDGMYCHKARLWSGGHVYDCVFFALDESSFVSSEDMLKEIVVGGVIKDGMREIPEVSRLRFELILLWKEVGKPEWNLTTLFSEKHFTGTRISISSTGVCFRMSLWASDTLIVCCGAAEKELERARSLPREYNLIKSEEQGFRLCPVGNLECSSPAKMDTDVNKAYNVFFDWTRKATYGGCLEEKDMREGNVKDGEEPLPSTTVDD